MTPTYTARRMATLIQSQLAHKGPLVWDDDQVISAAHDAFHIVFGYYPSECPMGRVDEAFVLVEEAAKLASQDPRGPHEVEECAP